MSIKSAPVVIVGAGPSGCSAALLLAKLGIPSILIERRETPSSHPAAHVINARTLEVWAQIDPALADEMFAASPKIDELNEIHWRTSLVGRKLGSISPLPEDPEHVARLLALSSYRTIHLGQHKVEPILWRWVQQNPLIDFRKSTNVWQLDQFDDQVKTVLRPAKDRNGQGPSETLLSRFALACDGANSNIRSKLGIKMEGDTLAHISSVFFHAECKPPLKELPVLAWLYNPDFAGVLINHTDGNFIIMTPYFPPVQSAADFDPEYWQQNIPKALGCVPEKLEIRSCGSWVMTAQVADHFQMGNVFLVGDAAHRFPPTGGYGLNTGVQDAHNLAWKLAAVLNKGTSPRLLESYETERKPIAEYNCAQSVSNHFKMDRVTAPLKMTGRSSMVLGEKLKQAPFSWLPHRWQVNTLNFLMRLAKKQTKPLLENSKRGKNLRAKMAAEIPAQAEHFSAIGLEIGFSYAKGVVAPEGSDKPIAGDGITEYLPTTWPGARIPHVPVHLEHGIGSNHLLLDMNNFQLLCTSKYRQEWDQILSKIHYPTGLSIKTESLDIADKSSTTWQAIFEVGEQGAVLVRPDGHVAWRSKLKPEAAAAKLQDAITTFWPN